MMGSENWIREKICSVEQRIMNLTCLASLQPVCGLHILPSPMRPRARCDRGARSPLAPTVPFSGTHDRHDSIHGWHPKRPQSDTKTATFYQQVKSHLVIIFLQLQHKSSPAEYVNFNIHIAPFRRYSGSKSKVIKNRTLLVLPRGTWSGKVSWRYFH